jgi:hypothetical protein
MGRDALDAFGKQITGGRLADVAEPQASLSRVARVSFNSRLADEQEPLESFAKKALTFSKFDKTPQNEL